MARRRRDPYPARVTAEGATRGTSLLTRLSEPEADRAARWWHLATAVVACGSLLLQLIVVLTGGAQPLGVRLVRFVSYFTIESNALVLVGTAMLVRDVHRDGAVWRALRLAGLVGITSSGLIYVVVLRSVVTLDGWAVVADAGLHYAVPVLAVGGWALFGPRERVRRLDVLAVLTWPLVWFAWTLGHGAVTRFYPYPFINVVERGYWSVLGNCTVVAALLVLLAAVARLLDRRLVLARR